MTYRTGNHWGVTIVREDEDGAQLAAVVTNGETRLAERICMLLNGPPYPKRCTMKIGVRGCVCEPWPDCYTARHTPDVDYARGAAEALAFVRHELDRACPPATIATIAVRRLLDRAAAELGVSEDSPSAPPSAPLAAEQPSAGVPVRAEVPAWDWKANERADIQRRIAKQSEHRPSSLGGDGLGYGPCVGCGQLWPCTTSRAERADPEPGWGES